MAESDSYKGIKLLSKDNYFSWATKVRLYLQSKNVFDLAITEAQPAQDAPEAERTAWYTANKTCQSFFMNCMDDAQGQLYLDSPSARSIWEALQLRYAGQGAMQRRKQQQLCHQLTQVKFRHTDTLEGYFTNIRHIAKQAAHAGRHIEDHDLVYYCLQGIQRRDLLDIVHNLQLRDGLTLDQAEQYLSEFAADTPNNLGIPFEPYNASRTNIIRGRGRDNRRSYSRIAHNLSSDNHIRYSSAPNVNFRETRACNYCNLVGHLERDCRKKAREMINGTLSNNRRPNTFRRGRSRRGPVAHQAIHNTSQNTEDEAVALSARRSEDRKFVFKASIPKTVLCTANKSGPNKPTKFNTDTGASAHLTCWLEWLENPKPVDIPIQLAGKDSILRATFQGAINLCTPYGDVTIENVLYSKELGDNLLSILMLDRKGVYYTGGSGKISFYHPDGRMFGEAFVEGDAYILQADIVLPNPPNGIVELSETIATKEKETLVKRKCHKSCISWELFHRRLGHPSQRRMEEIYNNQILRGVNVQKGVIKDCPICIQGKMKTQPLYGHYKIRTSRPLDTIYVDIFGRTPKPSKINHCYMLLIVDDYTRRYFTFFLERRSEAVSALRRFASIRQNEVGYKIKRIVTDNAAELTGQEMDDFCIQNGIQHIRTCPQTPAQNGLAERGIGLIVEQVRCLLQQAELPDDFWEFAASAAGYMHNLSPSTALPTGEVPMTRWAPHRKRPSGRHHRSFGCLCYYLLPSYQRQSKLSPKANPAIFLGYGTSRSGYLLYDPTRNVFLHSRNVRFREDIPGGTLLNNLTTLPKRKSKGKRTCDDSSSDSDFPSPPPPPHGQGPNNEEPRHLPDNNSPPHSPPKRPRGRPKGTTKAVMAERRRQLALQVGDVRDQTSVESECSNTSEDEGESDPLEASHGNVDIFRHTANTHTDVHIDPFIQVMCNKVKILDPSLPATYNEAVKLPDGQNWLDAMQEELNCFHTYDVWDLVSKPTNTKVVKTKWVYVKKYNPDGSLRKYKARLVAAGWNLKKNIDFDLSYSPVVRAESIRLMIAIAASKGYKLTFYDVRCAYLWSSIGEKPVYVTLPPGFASEIRGEDRGQCQGQILVYKLKKSVYGLPFSGRNWYLKFTEILVSVGLRQSEYDPCVFYAVNESFFFGIQIFVDDDLCASSSDSVTNDFMTKIRTKVDILLVESQLYLGLEIDVTQTGITICQHKYIKKILNKFNMTDCKAVTTPCEANVKLYNFHDSKPIDKLTYQEMLGSIMYLMCWSRPDLAFAISSCSMYGHDPRQIHFTALKRILRYLKGTQHFMLHYEHNLKGVLWGCSDASWDSCPGSKSVSGYCIFVGNAAISWKTKKQTNVALSTCEAEMNSISELTKDLVPIRGLLSELCGEYVSYPVIIHSDSLAAIELSKNGGNTASRHYTRRVNHVRDQITCKNIKLEFEAGNTLVADVFTKAVPGNKMREAMEKYFGLY